MIKNSDATQSWTSSTQYIEERSGATLDSNLRRRHEVRFSPALLSGDGETLCNVLSRTPAMILTTPSVDRHFGALLRAIVSRSRGDNPCGYHVIECREHTKDIRQCLEICALAFDAKLPRGGTLVAIGGGVCLDIVGLASAIYRRGVRNIKIPTTLIGIIDAGIGIKNAVNFEHKKSAIGTFYPPELTLLDPKFLRTLPERHVKDGLSEALKIAIVGDGALFELMEAHAGVLLPTRLSTQTGHDVIAKSVKAMLTALSGNLYELDSYRRMVDFGHTFSPFIESDTAYQVTHGQAVAVDIAISTTLARHLGLLGEAEFERIVRLMLAMELPIFHECILQTRKLHQSLASIVAHRDGALNLVVPSGIGSYQFIDSASEVSIRDIERVVSYLEARNAAVRDCRVVY